MASFFKGKCLLYWFAWIVCLSYYFGTAIYTTNYIPTTETSHQIFNMVKYICLFNFFMSITGCIFIKCSITHVLCGIFYVVPMLVVNLVFFVLGVKATHLSPVPAVNSIPFIRHEFQTTGNYPKWFENVQYWRSCCGIFSYLDHPILFHGAGDGKRYNLSNTVPQHCCPDPNGQSDCVERVTKLDKLNGNSDGKSPREILDELKGTCNLMKDWIGSNLIPYYNSTANAKVYPADDIDKRINRCGCLEIIDEMNRKLIRTHFLFFVIIATLAFAMIVVYLKGWCRQRGDNQDSGSSHSLDVDPKPTAREFLGRIELDSLIPTRSASTTLSSPDRSATETQGSTATVTSMVRESLAPSPSRQSRHPSPRMTAGSLNLPHSQRRASPPSPSRRASRMQRRASRKF